MIRVACAIIKRGTDILATQRGEHHRAPFAWEFPGGKLEAGESAEECVRREIEEELAIGVIPDHRLPPIRGIHGIELIPFVCSWESGDLHLIEHVACRWGSPEALDNLAWDVADRIALGYYRDWVARQNP